MRRTLERTQSSGAWSCPAIAVVLTEPPEVVDLVRELDVSNQSLTALPPELLTHFPRLTTLNLARNDLSTFPVEAALERFRCLRFLDLSSNFLFAWSDIVPLGALPALESLSLLRNALPQVESRALTLTRLVYDRMPAAVEAMHTAEDMGDEETGYAPFAREMVRVLNAADAKAQAAEAAKRISLARTLSRRFSPTPSPNQGTVLSSQRAGMSRYRGLAIGSQAPHELRSELARRLGSDTTEFYADLRCAPTPRRGPFPMLKSLNERPLTIEDFDEAHQGKLYSGRALFRRLEAEEAHTSTSRVIAEGREEALASKAPPPGPNGFDSVVAALPADGAVGALLRVRAAANYESLMRSSHDATKRRVARLLANGVDAADEDEDEADDDEMSSGEGKSHRMAQPAAAKSAHQAAGADTYTALLRATAETKILTDEDLAMLRLAGVDAASLGARAVSMSLEDSIEPTSHALGLPEIVNTMYSECGSTLEKSRQLLGSPFDTSRRIGRFDAHAAARAIVPLSVYVDVPQYEDIGSLERATDHSKAKSAAARAQRAKIKELRRKHQRYVKLPSDAQDDGPERKVTVRLTRSGVEEVPPEPNSDEDADVSGYMAAGENKPKLRLKSSHGKNTQRRGGSLLGELEQPQLAATPYIYAQYQRLRRRAGPSVGSTSIAAARAASKSTRAGAVEILAALPLDELDAALGLMDVQIELNTATAAERRGAVSDQRHVNARHERAAFEAKMREHQNRIRLIEKGVLKSFADDLPTTLPTQLRAERAERLSAMQTRQLAVAKSVLTMEPGELGAFLKNAHAQSIETANDAANAANEAAKGDASAVGLRQRRADPVITALNMRRSEAKAKLEDLRVFTSKAVMRRVIAASERESDAHVKEAVARMAADLGVDDTEA